MWAIGFILSPLSFWNDLLVNIPLSWAVAWPVSLLYRPAFPIAFAVAYFATNVLGMWLMDHAVRQQKNPVNGWLVALVGCGLLIGAALVGFIPFPFTFILTCVGINIVGVALCKSGVGKWVTNWVEWGMTLLYTALILWAVCQGWIPVPNP